LFAIFKVYYTTEDMVKIRPLVVLFFLAITLFVSAGDSSSEKFNPGDMIMHHILDSHEWHILDWPTTTIDTTNNKNDTIFGKTPVSIPLPIILFHEGHGLTAFMSSKFHHGDSVYWASDSIGYFYDHGKITCVNSVVSDKSQWAYNDEATDKLWDFSITKNVSSLFFSILILLFVFLSAGKVYMKSPEKTPRGLRGFLEIMIVFVRDDIAKPAIGEKHYNRYMPFLLTVFFFIWLNNLLGLIPVFPGGANLTGNIAVPLVLAAMVFIITTLSGKKSYWQHIFAMPGVPKPVLIMLTPVEIIGVFLKPIVLMIRLFANITAGHIIILSFFSLIFIFGDINIFAGYGASVMSVLFVIFMTMLELLVAFLQAYVFTLLSAIYFGAAVEEEH